MTYHERLTNHLARYRKNELGVEHCGVFEYRGKSIPKEHILPVELRWLNVLAGVRESVQGYVQEHPHIRLHRYFHHLNSSQAFALNLFVPYFEGGSTAAQALLRALGVEGSLANWNAEEVSDTEEQTNIDVTWAVNNGPSYFCEVKLSENEFGTAKHDEEHVAKLAKTYAPVLRGHVAEELLQSERFCRNYQILRMVWYALRNQASVLMFILPRGNRGLWKTLSNALPDFADEVRARIKMVAIEDVLERLAQQHELSPELLEHAKALRAKYLLPATARV